MAEVMIVGKNKRPGFTHTRLGDALREAGVDAYNCTPRYTPNSTRSNCKVLINHGVSDDILWMDSVPEDCLILNTPVTVEVSANKVRSQQHMKLNNVPHLRFTTSYTQACDWVSEGSTLLARHRLNSFQGRGIQIIPGVRPEVGAVIVPPAPLYTELFEGKGVREYRVYIVDERMADIRQKQRYRKARLIENGIDPDDPVKKIIRCHKNGWVFAKNMKGMNDRRLILIQHMAEHAARAFGLGYGAIDLIAQHVEDESGGLGRIAIIEPNTNIAVYDSRVMANIVNAIKEIV